MIGHIDLVVLERRTRWYIKSRLLLVGLSNWQNSFRILRLAGLDIISMHFFLHEQLISLKECFEAAWRMHISTEPLLFGFLAGGCGELTGQASAADTDSGNGNCEFKLYFVQLIDQRLSTAHWSQLRRQDVYSWFALFRPFFCAKKKRKYKIMLNITYKLHTHNFIHQSGSTK